MIDRACISLNSRCNLNCSYCHFASKKNNQYAKLNEFSVKEVEVFCVNLSDYIKRHSVPSFKLGIVGSGEPLLSFKALKAIVEYFDNGDLKTRIKMYVISNGTLLTEEIVHFFFEHKDIIELNISLDGDPEINKKLRGSYPDLTKYQAVFGKMPKINSVVTREVIDNQNRILEFFVKSGFTQINFSKVFGTNDPKIAISKEEYALFLKNVKVLGIESRQNENVEKYDCAKYGRLCGVGKNNVFITRTSVYPCGRFMDLKQFMIGKWDDQLDDIEERLHGIEPCPKGECYYEYNKVGV